jgi:hypothetical protein
MRAFALLLASTTIMLADGPGVISSPHVKSDFTLTADPASHHWKDVKPIYVANGPTGEKVPNHETAVRSVWSDKAIYFLYTCPYEKLHLKPNPSTTTETNLLWDWDVAEVFIGSDFDDINHYYEFEVSPQGEWVDLDIHHDAPNPADGWLWQSGFQSKARLDEAKKIFYIEMKIPFDKIDKRPPQNYREFRINFYRCQGADPGRKYLAWQPTGKVNFHVPEAFGRLVLRK